MDREQLLNLYPWLSITTTVEEYVAPDYYGNLLKEYVFDGKTDLEIFSSFLNNMSHRDSLDVLELGCGSGRATNVLFSSVGKRLAECDLVDLSKQMIDYSRERFSKQKNITFINSDSVEYLQATKKKYDLIFSLWSFSHSVHQILTERGLADGKRIVSEALKKMFIENIKESGAFFLIHFDSLSDEQTILMQQWKKVFPIFEHNTVQSPSKLLIDEVFQQLHDEQIVSASSRHYVGEEITYTSVNEALETFINFHMESYFNESELLPEIIKELKGYFVQFTDSEGRVKIKPGCFIYQATKL